MTIHKSFDAISSTAEIQEILQLKKVCKTYHSRLGVMSSLRGYGLAVRAVDGIDLSLRTGEVVALAGESGCGKSTLSRLMCGLEPPTTGQVLFKGRDVNEMDNAEKKAMRQEVQMIFQDPYESLDPRYTIHDTVAEPLANFGVAKSEHTERVAAALEEVELRPYNNFIGRYPHELSGGQRQRVAVARAMVLRPKVLIADEPVSMVDASVRAGLVNLMLHLRESHNMAYVLVTHDLSVARHMADRLAIMYLGQLVEIGPVDEVINSPLHPYTSLLLSAVPIPGPRRTRRRVQTVGEPPSATQIPPGCRFHPRCSRAGPDCSRQVPMLRRRDGDHSVACLVP